MKYVLIPLILSVCLISYGQGIEFQKGSWEETLAKAKESDKIIFVDAYTTWCGPCKMMDRRIFTDKSVGAFYNEHFINTKMDMEKGEGPAIARKYQVMAYPSFLFIDGDGKLVHRGIGYQPIEAFLALGKQVTDGDGIGQLQLRFENGDRDPTFLKTYAETLAQLDDPMTEQVVAAYLNTQEDWSTEEHMMMLINSISTTESPFFTYLIDHRPDFQQAFGTSPVNEFIINLINRDLLQGARTLPAPERMQELYEKSFPKLAPMLTAKFNMDYHRMSGDQEAYISAATAYTDGYGMDDASLLNEVAWNFYENVDQETALTNALKWANRSVELDKQYYNLDTLAALHFKLGNKEAAKLAAEEAIGLAQATGQDASMTEKLLTQIEAM